MDQITQTQITDQNKTDFYKRRFPNQFRPQSALVQLHQYFADQYILADCCGWYYKKHWPDFNIIGLETVQSVKQFKLPADRVQGLINDTLDKISWPTIKTTNCVLVLDHSPMLKYKSIKNIVDTVSSGAEKYAATTVVLNLDTYLIDSSRVVDRFRDLTNLVLPNYVVHVFDYSVDKLKITFQRQVNYVRKQQDSN